MNGSSSDSACTTGPHVRRRFEHHAVDQPEGQLDALVDAALAVGEEGQALGARGQVVLEDRADLVEFALQDVLLVLGEVPLPGDAAELAVEERGSELPPVIQRAGGEGHGEELPARRPGRRQVLQLLGGAGQTVDHGAPSPPSAGSLRASTASAPCRPAARLRSC